MTHKNNRGSTKNPTIGINKNRRQSMTQKGIPDLYPKDPICGLELKEQHYFRKFQGHTYYFCSTNCRDKFMEHPLKYTKS